MKIRAFRRSSTIAIILFLMAVMGLPGVLFAETDVTDKVQLVQSRLMFDRSTNQNYIDVSVKNISQDVLLTPIKVVIDSISSADVTIANADGTTDDGKPYFEYTTETGQLLAGSTTSVKRVSFNNAKRLRFSYTIKVHATIPEASAVIGPEGGVVEVTDLNSPIFGAKVEVPEGAFTDDKTVTLRVVELPKALPGTSTQASFCIDFEPDGAKFDTPLTLSIPYKDLDNDGIIDGTNILEIHSRVLFYDETTGEWVDSPEITFDTENNKMIILVNHFTNFIVSSETPEEKIPVDVVYWSISDMKTGISNLTNEGYFPIKTYKRLLNSKVIFAPIIQQPPEKEQFKFRYEISASNDRYWEFYKQNVNDGFEEIDMVGWYDIKELEDRFNTIWVKNASIDLLFPKAIVKVYPYSFRYYDISDAVLRELAGGLIEEAFMDVLKSSIPSLLSPNFAAAAAIWGLCKTTYDIVQFGLSNTNPVVAVCAIGLNISGERLPSELSSDEEKMFYTSIPRNSRFVTGVIDLDFTNAYHKNNRPEAYFNRFGIQTARKKGIFWDSTSPFLELLSENNLKTLPKGRYFKVVPRIDYVPTPWLNVPNDDNTNIISATNERCFFLRGGSSGINMNRKFSLVKIDDNFDSDNDGDGYTGIQGDLNDNDPTIYPGATEIPYDGIDQDCDGIDLTDVDGDGFDSIQVGGTDTNDNDPNINPGAQEVCGDGIDNDCDGEIDEEDCFPKPIVDTDGDGIPDDQDLFKDDPNEWADSDSDGVGNNSDNCPNISNPNQADADGDGIGDVCESGIDINQVYSSFDYNDEGWVESNDPDLGTGIISWVNSGGNTGGYISVKDLSEGFLTIIAPSKFTGDLSTYNGGTLSFDIKLLQSAVGDFLTEFGTVVIKSSSGTATVDIITEEPTIDWKTHSVPMTAAAFGVDEATWDAILSDVIEISIIVDCYNWYNDVIGLDNFKITKADNLNSGLVAYYPFNGDAKDASGNGYDGTEHNGARYIYGIRGQALSLDGIDDFVSVSNVTSLFPGYGDFSVSFWVQYKNNVGENAGKIFILTGDDIYEWFQSERGGNTITFGGKSGDTEGTNVQVEIDGTNWHHIVGIRTGTKLSTYVDGQFTNSLDEGRVHDVSTSNGLLYFGKRTYDPVKYLDANIDEFRIYNKALSEAEIQALYDEGNNLNSGLVAYYPFNGDAKDESGNGNDGIEFGGVSYSKGVNGLAVSLDGVDDYIDVSGIASDLDGVRTGSISIWFKTDGNPKPNLLFYYYNNENNGYSFITLGDFTSQGQFINESIGGVIRPNLGFGYHNGNEYYMDGKWHHAVFVMGTNYHSLSVDGEKLYLTYINESVYTGNSNTGNIMWSGGITGALIGKHVGFDAYQFRGSIDDVRIYNRALSEAETQALYEEGNNLNSSLEAYYPFDGNANDHSGNGNDGTVYGATLTTDRFGNPNSAYRFDGTDSTYIDVEKNTVSVMGKDQVSVSAWIMSERVFNDYKAIWWESCEKGSSTLGFAMEFIDGNYGLRYRLPDGTTRVEVDSGVSPTPGVWHHYVVTLDSQYAKIFVDGELLISEQSLLTAFSDVPSVDVNIGRAGFNLNSPGSGTWVGKIDEVKVYHRVLSQVEIQELYNSQGQTTLWQIGNFDLEPWEFPHNSTFYDVFQYNVDSDPDDEINSPNFPVTLYKNASFNHTSMAAREIQINFGLSKAYSDLFLRYDRKGSETNEISLNGSRIFTSYGLGEGVPKSEMIPVGSLSAGSHTITIEYVGGGDDDSNDIDGIKLIESP